MPRAAVAATMSLAEARRAALHAQGFATARPSRPDLRHARAVLQRLGAVQIDAVNVLVRSHELPFFSRLGPHDRRVVDRLAYERGEAFEYLAHALSYVDSELHRALRWRMTEEADRLYWRKTREVIEKQAPGYAERVLAEVAERGPLTFNELADPARRARPKTKYAESTLLWSSKRPSDGKFLLDGFWREGRLAVGARRAGFERAFDLPERVLPAAVLAEPAPPAEEAQRTLVLRAVQALGVAWIKDVADYWRLPVAVARARLRELAEAGLALAVAVEGVPGAAYADPAAVTAPVAAVALLSPFDNLLWERPRNVRLFGFEHSFEIYVPEAKRRYGYYVLPFLLDESLVARVDLKADRARGLLLVQAAWTEPGHAPATVVGPLVDELKAMAAWLDLGAVEVGDRGDLAGLLRSAAGSG